MTIPIYQVDAFSSELFKGNPAAICILKEWPDDQTLLNIAKENNLAETAFILEKEYDVYHLRWFTPEIEMDLCGHATLASAFVIMNYLKTDLIKIFFDTISGRLSVRQMEGLLEMDFPSRPPERCDPMPQIEKSLSIKPTAWFKSRDYMLLYNSESEIRELKVNEQELGGINLDPGGIIVTAIGDKCDFVSRFFTPGAAIFEDPVTGSAHCSLTPFWAQRLNKTVLSAQQLSERGGVLICEQNDGRVKIRGQAVPYLQGTIRI